MAEKDPLSIEFDPNYLARIVDAAVVTTTEVVNSHFEYLTKADLSKLIEQPQPCLLPSTLAERFNHR